MADSADSVLSGIVPPQPDPVPVSPQPVELPDVPIRLKNSIRALGAETELPFKPPQGTIDYADVRQVRQYVLDRALSSLTSLKPTASGKSPYELSVVDVKYTGPDPTVDDEIEAMTAGKSLSKRISGQYVLKDRATGKVVAKSGRKTLMNVPWLTSDGYYVVRGVPYSFVNQFRMDPGIYTRTASDGFTEAQFNTAQGFGVPFRVRMDPKNGIFSLRIAGHNVPLYHMLSSMGVPDQAMEKAWGKQLFETNKAKKAHSSTVAWLNRIIATEREQQLRTDPEGRFDDKDLMRNYFKRMRLDAENTERLMGIPYPEVSPESILHGSLRVLNVARGDEEADSRDNPSNQRVYDFGDHLSTYLNLDRGGVFRGALWKLRNDPARLERIPSALFDQHIQHHLNNSGLAQVMDLINPLESYNQRSRITRLGEGAIENLESAPDEAREVQPGYFSFVDAIRAPECYVAEMEVLTDTGWKRWPDVVPNDRLACEIRPGAGVSFELPLELMSYPAPEEGHDVVVCREPMLSFAVTSNHRMIVWTGHDGYPGPVKEVLAGDLAEWSEQQGGHFDVMSGDQIVASRLSRARTADLSRMRYFGAVYCARVPGGMLYVRAPGGDPFWCGNSLKIGLDMFLARTAVKGPDNRLYSRLRDTRTGKIVWLNPVQLEKEFIGEPGTAAARNKFVQAMSPRYGIQYVPRKDVRYELLSGDDLFSGSSDTLPLKSAVKGMRQLMGVKMHTHAVPLVTREAPLVETPFRDGTASMEALGTMAGAVRSPVAGTVISVGKRHMVVQSADGEPVKIEYADWKPYARKTHLEQHPVVKRGDTVKPGSLLVTSNYTDEDGRLALGRNLRVGYMGYRGRNFEDALVISESAAKKLTSLHTYGEEWEPKQGEEAGQQKYVTLFPSVYSKEQLDKIGSDGLIRVGSEIGKGDPVVLAVQTRDPSQTTMGRRLHQDRSITWEHDEPGVVKAVVKTRDGYKLFVEARHRASVGDKITLAQGAKGVISEIVPDGEMIRDSEGRPLELLLSAKGVVSRTNPSVLLTAQLGKVAAKTGNRYVLPGSFSDSAVGFVKGELEKAGLSDTEDVFDPRSGKTVPKVFTGLLHVYKAQQMSEAKGHARDVGGYSMDEDPGRGGGCFVGEQTIHTLHGDVRISRLVEKRMSEHVWSLDPVSGTWSYKPIVDWFVRHAAESDVLSIHVGDALSTCGGKTTKHDSVLRCTKDHAIYLFDGSKVDAGSLRAGDVLTSCGPVPSDMQRGAILGTFLGDAYISDDIQIMHSETQRNYAAFKQSLFSGLLATCSSLVSEGKAPNGRSFRRCLLTIPSASLLSFVTRTCYLAGKKAINKEWLAGVTDLGLCLWFLDDGSAAYKLRASGDVRLAGATIATHGFDPIEVEMLCQFVRERLTSSDVVMSSEGTAVDGHDKYVLRLGVSAARRMVDLVANNIPWQHIPPSKKGLIDEVKSVQNARPVYAPGGVCEIGSVPAVVRRIEQYKHPKGKTSFPVYDFSVADTHTYTTGGVAVSNSSSKHIGPMETDALLAHGATNLFKELKTVHGQYNPELWRQIKLGGTPSIPRTPTVYDKFRALIRAAGVTLKEGTKEGDSVFAATDRDIVELTGDREITSAETYDRKMRPIKGGLFDSAATGSEGAGDRFAFIRLPEPMLNPHMESAARVLLGLRKADLDDIISGKVEVKGLRGGAALKSMLEAVDLDKTIDDARAVLKADGMVSKKDAAAKQLMYAEAMKARNKKPAEFMMTRVPVLPPKFRRIVQQDDRIVVPDLNYLYRRLIHSIDDFNESRSLGEEARADARADMMHAYRALIGVEDPVDKDLQAKRVGGVVQQLLGKGSPKYSFVQRKVLGVNVDMSGLAVVVPNPELKLNQIGIPEDSAWTLFGPFVIRRLVEKGYNATAAAEAVKAREKTVFPVLKEVMQERPVLANRAPTLHKYGIMAFHAIPVAGNALQVSPQVDSPFGADHDGDDQLGSVVVAFDESEWLKLKSASNDTMFFGKPAVWWKQRFAGILEASE